MSNLGDYQRMSIIAKKVGGPRNLLLTTVGLSVGTTLAVGAVTYKWIKMKKKTEYLDNNEDFSQEISDDIYQFNNEALIEGIHISIGDEFRVLQILDDAIMIVFLAKPDEPFFVSSEFLVDNTSWVIPSYENQE